MVAGAASWQRGWDLRLLQLRFYAMKFSAAHLKKVAVANNRVRASNTNPQDNEPGGGRWWALSEEGAVLLLERPKRAINPQIQRRTRALSSLRKAWDVSAGRTNHAASPAEVASSAKPRRSPGYHTQIPSICHRQGTPASLQRGGSPPAANWPPPTLRGKTHLCTRSPFPRHTSHLPPQEPRGSRGSADHPPSRVQLR